MRYHELISEKIILRPRSISYIKNRINDLTNIDSRLNHIANNLQNYSYEDIDLATEFLKYGSDYSEYYHYLEDLIRFSKRKSTENSDINDVIYSLKSFLEHGKNFLRYVISSTERLNDELNVSKLDGFYSILNTASNGAYQYGYREEKDYDAEYHKAMDLIHNAQQFAALTENLKTIINEMLPRMREIDNYYGQMSWKGNYRPEHGKIEILYHATAHAPDIVRNGFRDIKPEDRLGVGNIGDQDEISFTHDLRVAQTIYRTFKEIWLIAHGQLSAAVINKWANSENINPVEMFGGGITLKDIKTKKQIAQLYGYYIALSEIRDNPFIVGIGDLVSHFEKIDDIKDIGVLECQVELDSTTQYKQGEAEFRVLPNQVKSIKRLF